MYLVLPGQSCPRYCIPRRLEIEIGLQHQPEVRGISEMARQPERRIGADSAFATCDLGDAAPFNPDFMREHLDIELHWNQEFAPGWILRSRFIVFASNDLGFPSRRWPRSARCSPRSIAKAAALPTSAGAPSASA